MCVLFGWLGVWPDEEKQFSCEVISPTAALIKCFAFSFLARMVASYLVHHSYCATAEAFAKSTNQAVHEELASIKNRQSESFCVGMVLNNAAIKLKIGFKYDVEIMYNHGYIPVLLFDASLWPGNHSSPPSWRAENSSYFCSDRGLGGAILIVSVLILTCEAENPYVSCRNIVCLCLFVL